MDIVSKSLGGEEFHACEKKFNQFGTKGLYFQKEFVPPI